MNKNEHSLYSYKVVFRLLLQFFFFLCLFKTAACTDNIPPLDQTVPNKLETATLAMG